VTGVGDITNVFRLSDFPTTPVAFIQEGPIGKTFAPAGVQPEFAQIERAPSWFDQMLAVNQVVEFVALAESANTVLANQVRELEGFQSDFVRNVQPILADRIEFQRVGDRFAIPSTLTFTPGSAEIDAASAAELDQVALLVLELMEQIPESVDWVLRVDGHTDLTPIQFTFASNRALSAARALASVNYLEAKGIPSERLALGGFGEFRPITEETTPDALSSNRRVEFTLTTP
jgi:chemotaxis protein MotB